VGEPVPGGEPVAVGVPVAVGEAVPADEAAQAGEAIPDGEVAQVGEAVPVAGETGTEGVGALSVGEGVGAVSVGEGVVVVAPWIDCGDDCPRTAATSLGPCLWGWSADRNLNTSDLCGYSLRGTCEIASTEMKRATFSGECLGRNGWSRARTAVMAAATAPTVTMIGIGRFHHGIGGGLAG
jgi:hypothetical protein